MTTFEKRLNELADGIRTEYAYCGKEVDVEKLESDIILIANQHEVPAYKAAAELGNVIKSDYYDLAKTIWNLADDLHAKEETSLEENLKESSDIPNNSGKINVVRSRNRISDDYFRATYDTMCNLNGRIPTETELSAILGISRESALSRMVTLGLKTEPDSKNEAYEMAQIETAAWAENVFRDLSKTIVPTENKFKMATRDLRLSVKDYAPLYRKLLADYLEPVKTACDAYGRPLTIAEVHIEAKNFGVYLPKTIHSQTLASCGINCYAQLSTPEYALDVYNRLYAGTEKPTEAEFKSELRKRRLPTVSGVRAVYKSVKEPFAK